MKTAIYFLLLLVAVCYGCGNGHTPCPHLLHQAERWTEICPDSALACLDSFDVSSHDFPEEVRIYSQLLRIKAEDKLYIPHTSDSLINRIVRFYEHRGDDRRLAEALYYQGGVYRDCNLHTRAIRSYRRAAEVGCDHDTLNGRIYGELTALYAYQKAYSASMNSLRRALLYNIRCKDDKGVAYGWRDMARIFSRTARNDSAEVYYRKAYTLMREKGFLLPAYGILSEWANFNYEQGRYDRAKAFAYEVLAHRFSSVAALTLAKSYQAEGHLDSARFYSLEALKGTDIEHHRAAYDILKEIALSQDRPDDARRYAECFQTASDSISKMTHTEAVVRIGYEEEKHDLLSRLKWQRYVLSFVFLVLVTGVIYALRHIRAARKENHPDEAHIQQANAVSNPLKEQVADERKEDVTALPVKQGLFAPFLSVTHSSQLTEAYWSQLNEAINSAYPNFIFKLYQYYPKLSSHELHVCCLTKIGMPRKQMAELLNHSASSISNTLSRLYTKITGEKGGVYKMSDLVEKLT